MASASDGYITPAEAETQIAGLRGFDNINQLEDHFYQTQFQQQHNLSFSGGGANNTFRASINYTTSDGQAVGTKTDRFLIDLANNIKINDKLSLDIIGNLTFNDSESTPIDYG